MIALLPTWATRQAGLADRAICHGFGWSVCGIGDEWGGLVWRGQVAATVQPIPPVQIVAGWVTFSTSTSSRGSRVPVQVSRVYEPTPEKAAQDSSRADRL